MSPRKTILRELNAAGHGSFRRPSELSGFEKQPPKFREAVNGLLRDQLISGNQDADGNLVITLNERRMAEVEREIRPWFKSPMMVLVGVGIAVLAGAAFLV